MSPYLFMLTFEVLSKYLKNQHDRRHLMGADINRRCDSVTHLLFANKCLIVRQATLLTMKVSREIFERYWSASGWSINLEKFTVYFGKVVDVHIQIRVFRFLAICTGSMPSKYLDVYVGGKRIPPRYFDGLIATVEA